MLVSFASTKIARPTGASCSSKLSRSMKTMLLLAIAATTVPGLPGVHHFAPPKVAIATRRRQRNTTSLAGVGSLAATAVLDVHHIAPPKVALATRQRQRTTTSPAAVALQKVKTCTLPEKNLTVAPASQSAWWMASTFACKTRALNHHQRTRYQNGMEKIWR